MPDHNERIKFQKLLAQEREIGNLIQIHWYDNAIAFIITAGSDCSYSVL
ncbi:hypothetical protein [Nostoc sp.]